MAKITPQEFAEKWARRLSAATPDIQRGVNRVDQSPTEKAAAKKDKMLANLTAAVQGGKWEAGLRRVTLADWKKQILEKGVPRISQGVQGAQGKVGEFASQLLAYQEGLVNQISNMPDLTLEDNINRMTTFIRGMSKFRKG
ncbi:MAG: hypothetical protein ROW48_18350 [Bellilinea sp.]|jgi:hypothetical protein